jgi:hypothetical protein
VTETFSLWALGAGSVKTAGLPEPVVAGDGDGGGGEVHVGTCVGGGSGGLTGLELELDGLSVGGVLLGVGASEGGGEGHEVSRDDGEDGGDGMGSGADVGLFSFKPDGVITATTS